MSKELLIMLLAGSVVSLGAVEYMRPRRAQTTTIRYVAIGDSYTSGEGALPEEAWPNVLTRDLAAHGLDIDLVSNPARDGWTTQQAIDEEMPIFEASRPTFGTLLIGVNDWCRGVDAPTFCGRIQTLMDRMQASLPRDRLLVLTIPDFGVTPGGPGFGHGRDIAKGVAEFNEIIKQEAAKRQLPVVDLFMLSKAMGTDATLLGADGLHPSAKEYALWEQEIFPAAYALLTRKRD